MRRGEPQKATGLTGTDSGAGPIRLAANFLLWAALGTVFALLILFAAPRLAGGQSYAVLTDSMRGAAGTGSQVIVLPVAADRAERGQIVAFEDPARPGSLIQHRALSVRPAGGRIHFVTAGDAAQGVERWSVANGSEVGRVVAVVPWAGYVMGLLSGPAGRTALILASTAALAGLALVAIWSGSQSRQGEGALS